MRAIILSATAAAAVSIPVAANSTSITLGGPLAVHCYHAAVDRIVTRESMSACDRALTEEPLTAKDRAATLVNRGVLMMIGGSLAEADRSFDAAIATAPGAADAWLNKGFLRLRQGNGRAALPLLQRALDLRATRPAMAYYARGIAHEQTGNLSAAYADLIKARDLDPDWDLPARDLARYQLRGG